MKKLKSSRLVKTLCFLFALLFTAGVAGNVVLGLLLSESNLFYAEKEQLTELAMEEIVEHYHQTDVRRYLLNVLSFDNLDNRNTEFYQAKFSREKSNLSFTVTDQNGTVVLNNYPAVDKEYTFTKTLQIYDYDYDMALLNEPAEETVMPDTTEMPEASDEEATVPFAWPQTTGEEPGMTQPGTTTAGEGDTTPYEPTANGSGADIEPTQAPRSEHVYILEDNGNPYRFRYYYYGEEYDEAILQYCVQNYESQPDNCPYATYTDEWITYREDDFALSDNGVVYYRGDREPTTYISDAEQDYPHTDYTVKYTLPKTFTAKDLFYYAQKLTGYAYGYIHKIIPLTVCFAVAAFVFFILFLLCAGHVRGEDAPRAKGLHRLPYDIVCAVAFVVLITLTVFIFVDGPYRGPGEIALAAFALALTLMLFLSTTVVRIKAKTIGKNFFVVWLVKGIVTLCKKAGENMNVLWKLGLIFAGSVVAEFIYSLLLFEEEAFIFLWVVVKLLEIPLLLWLAICWNRIQNGARKLSEGHITEKVDTNRLFGEFKKNADYLNAINDGVNDAVRERMKSESMKTELITNVSHDLKTPLTSIINYVDLLKETDVKDEKAKEYIEVIDRQSLRLKKLCSDIVDASKAATGNLQVDLEPTALNVMLSQVMGEYDERLKAKRLCPVPELPDGAVTVNADGKLLWRVFDNLLNNVCKYAMEGTRVYLSLLRDGQFAQVVFKNISGTPLNVSPEELTERFVRGDSSRTAEGSGLGLSIAKSLTELMGGRFSVTIDGDLFKVTVTFPLIQA